MSQRHDRITAGLRADIHPLTAAFKDMLTQSNYSGDETDNISQTTVVGICLPLKAIDIRAEYGRIMPRTFINHNTFADIDGHSLALMLSYDLLQNSNDMLEVMVGAAKQRITMTLPEALSLPYCGGIAPTGAAMCDVDQFQYGIKAGAAYTYATKKRLSVVLGVDYLYLFKPWTMAKALNIQMDDFPQALRHVFSPYVALSLNLD